MRYITRAAYISNWPDEPRRNGRRVNRRDADFQFGSDRRDYIFVRDRHCAHCGVPLFEETQADEAALAVRIEPAPVMQESLLGQARAVSNGVRYEQRRASSVTRRLPAEIDHIFFYWAAARLKSHFDSRTLELVGQIAGVASCIDCNNKRQLTPPEEQLLNRAVADEAVKRMQRLFANHILADPDVDPIADTYRFCRALSLLRKLLTGEGIAERAS